MSLKETLKEWFQEDEDRLTDLSIEEIATNFSNESQAEIEQSMQEIRIEMVVENLQEMEGVSFHAMKNIYPYPTSEELHQAKIKLDPTHTPKERHSKKKD